MARRALRLTGAGLIVLAAVVSAVFFLTRKGTGSRASRNVPAELRAPEGVRIRVQVVNSTTTRGLARRATMLLRDRGFDVVASGTAHDQRDSTLVLDHTIHPVWSGRVARAFNGARVQLAPDTSRYVDITVLVGATWRPPAEPFYP